ncbi:MAG: SIMPL domain-containing protein [Leptolyngbyaceae cyanobacterium SL_7_1]|nr:SIMPL domain-containing protein [Leptolyngbyaceae cyanobacterium SL_7_1]
MISVLGNGQASAPADYAGIQMVFGAGDLYPNPETPTPPAPLREADLQPLVEALTALNIPADNIEVYLSASPGFPPETAVSPRLQVQLDNPTHSSIQRVIEAVRQLDQENDRFNLQQFGVWYSLNDCRPLEEAARRSAIEDVQIKSQSIAAAAGMELGELVALSGGDVYPPLYGGYACPASPTSYIDPYSVPPPYTPFVPVEVRLTGTVTAVYEMMD